MTTADEIIETLNDLSNTKYIKKDIKTLVKTNLETIKEHTNDKEDKYINEIIDIISKENFKAIDRNRIKQLKPTIIKIAKKYEEEYNEECNEDDIDENLTVDKIEAKLDKKIPEYNCFGKNHPMRGVT